MIKTFTIIIFCWLTLLSTGVYAQTSELTSYLGRDVKYADMLDRMSAATSGILRQYPAAVGVYSSKSLKYVYDMGRVKGLTGARVFSHDSDLVAIINEFKRIPTFRFISFAGSFAVDDRSPRIIIPDNINELQQLEGVEFDSPDANVAQLLPKLKGLKNLSAISLSKIQERLPKEIFDLKHIRAIGLNTMSIRDVDISHARWEHVFFDGTRTTPSQLKADLVRIARLPSLKSLDLHACYFGDDMSALSEFKKIWSFKISGTLFDKGAQLFEHLGGLPSLRSLAVNFSYTDSLQRFDGLEKLKQLQQLTIENMKGMTTIPASIGGLSKLRSLKIFNTRIKQVPLNVFQLPALEDLTLYGQQLTTLPEGDFRCKKLKNINITYSKLTNIPDAITSLIKLETINMDGNQISKIPAQGWEKMSALKEIHLSNNHIPIFPGGLQQISGLKILALGGNQIDSMPDLTGKNYQLTLLDLGRNKLRSLPANIGKYDQLQVLFIGQNRLTDLPVSLGNCAKLKVLDASVEPTYTLKDQTDDSSKYLKALPKGLQNTPDLELLKLTGNKGIDANSVFNVLLSMPRQRLVAELGGIALTAIPPSPEWKDVSIARLVLVNNKLTTLPAELASAKKIGYLMLTDNPFPGDIPIIVRRGVKSRADLKVIYNELGVPFPDSLVTKKEYAYSLTGLASELYNERKYGKVVQLCDKALTLDPVIYKATVNRAVIGTCRFKTNDYKGALADFDRFITQIDKGDKKTLDGLEGAIGYYKADCLIALGRLKEAAQTHEYFAQRFNKVGAMLSAAVIYKEIGKVERYRQILDSILLLQASRVEVAKTPNGADLGGIITDHAETLIIAGRQDDAIKLLDGQKDVTYNWYDYRQIRMYLLTVANYLNHPDRYDQLKNELVAYFKSEQKIIYWDFMMFNQWAMVAIKDPVKQARLIEFGEIAKYRDR